MSVEKQPYTVALTGGIAAGKTFVSDIFKALGASIIDTDVIAHQIVAPGEPALTDIVNVFGPGILAGDGSLRRRELRNLIFADPVARRQLEAILHPRIRNKVRTALAKVGTPYCILVIPLLTDRDAYPEIDRVLVIDVAPQVQKTRLMARDQSSYEQAGQALAAQPDRAQRLALADDILDNSGTMQGVKRAVAKLHQKYTRLAQFAG